MPNCKFITECASHNLYYSVIKLYKHYPKEQYTGAHQFLSLWIHGTLTGPQVADTFILFIIPLICKCNACFSDLQHLEIKKTNCNNTISTLKSVLRQSKLKAYEPIKLSICCLLRSNWNWSSRKKMCDDLVIAGGSLETSFIFFSLQCSHQN